MQTIENKKKCHPHINVTSNLENIFGFNTNDKFNWFQKSALNIVHQISDISSVKSAKNVTPLDFSDPPSPIINTESMQVNNKILLELFYNFNQYINL